MRLQITTPDLHIKLMREAIPIYRKKKSSFYTECVKEESTTKYYERYRQFGDMTTPLIVNEGEDFTVTDFDSPYAADIYPKKRGLAFEVSTEALESEQGYGVLAGKVPLLSLSMNKGLEYAAANKILNNATSTTTDYVGMDAVALASTAHPLASGTASNRGVSSVDVALGITTLEQAIEQLGQQVSHKGDPYPMVGPFNLYVPYALSHLAKRLAGAENLPQGNDNDPNPAGRSIAKVIVMPYATGSSTHWALRSADDDEHGITLLRKRALRVRTFDKDNDMTKITVSEIYAFFHKDWRGYWYSAGA